jgi:hypothetical protein
VALGQVSNQPDLLDEVSQVRESTLSDTSIYTFLARERENLFPEERFKDLFASRVVRWCRGRWWRW